MFDRLPRKKLSRPAACLATSSFLLFFLCGSLAVSTFLNISEDYTIGPFTLKEEKSIIPVPDEIPPNATFPEPIIINNTNTFLDIRVLWHTLDVF